MHICLVICEMEALPTCSVNLNEIYMLILIYTLDGKTFDSKDFPHSLFCTRSLMGIGYVNIMQQRKKN